MTDFEHIKLPRRHVTILGGSGFVGTRLCQRLARAGTEFSIIDKVASHVFPERTRIADVRSLDELRQSIVPGTLIINLAAEHRDDVRPRSLYEDVNVRGAENVCTVARERQVRSLIFTSSVAVYGFAPPGADESSAPAPFNEYGRTKLKAEQVYKRWQSEASKERALTIVRPTVIFGEQNRGNVYNLLRQIAANRFVMIGDGKNRKSIAYVENVAAFLEFAVGFSSGVHTYNFVDSPDFTMAELVAHVKGLLGSAYSPKLRIPYAVGLVLARAVDGVALVTRRRFTVSAIRVKKFCANSVYGTAIAKTGFTSPVPLHEALERTVRYEFIEDHAGKRVFFSE